MPNITFIDTTGRKIIVDAAVGENLMQLAVDNDVDGIFGECGGGLACATCHCQIDETKMFIVGAPDDYEQAMLDYAKSPATPQSRLSCQVNISDEMDGMVVSVPEE